MPLKQVDIEVSTQDYHIVILYMNTNYYIQFKKNAVTHFLDNKHCRVIDTYHT